MTRAHLSRPVLDLAGNVVTDIVVRVIDTATGSPLTPLYAGPTETATRSNPHTYANGIIDFYTDEPVRVRLGVKKGAADEVLYEDVDVLAPTSADQDDIAIDGIDGIPGGTLKETLAFIYDAITDHIDDVADAHDASAVSFVPTDTIAATDVQAAVAEVSGDVTALTVRVTTIEDAEPAEGGGSGFRLGENGSVIGGDLDPLRPGVAQGYESLAIGDGAVAGEDGVVVIGYGAQAFGGNAVAIGYEASASGVNSMALGYDTSATAQSTLAVGSFSTATFLRATAIGESAEAKAQSGTAVGQFARVYTGAFGGTAVGQNSAAEAHSASAFGYGAVADDIRATALGTFSYASGQRSVAIGYGINALENDLGVIKVDTFEVLPSSSSGAATKVRLHASDATLHTIGIDPDGVLLIDGEPYGGGGGFSLQGIVSGPLMVADHVLKPGLRVIKAGTATTLVAHIDTPPTGGPVTIRVYRHNGSTGAETIGTITIDAGSGAGVVENLAVACAGGDLIRFDITAVGSDEPGADVNLSVDFE